MIGFLVVEDLRIVQLWSVPAANTIICAKITLDFKMIDGRPVPLQSQNKEKKEKKSEVSK